jgi:hypothetical protein
MLSMDHLLALASVFLRFKRACTMVQRIMMTAAYLKNECR